MAMAVLLAQRWIHIPKNLPIEKYFRETQSAWLLLAFGVFVAPFVEEVFFRGLLFPALGRTFTRKRELAGLAMWLLVVAAGRGAYVHLRWHMLSHAMFWICGAGLALWIASQMLPDSMDWQRGAPMGSALILTSALFALIHQGQLAGAAGPLTILFCVGLVLTTVRYLTDSVCASWIIHFSYNATLFSVMLLATHGFRNLEQLAK